MENYLFRAAMPYRVKVEGGSVVVENRYYKTLFVGRIKLPISARDYEAMKATFLENAEEPFTPEGGSFWLYDDNTSPLGASYKKINGTLLKGYYSRLTCLLELFDGVDYSDDNPLIRSCTQIDLLDERIKEKDAQIKEKDAQISRLLGVIERMSGNAK